jgi:hypothetical protein
MLVFVDESGDSGMKHKAGTSQLFMVAAVIFVENKDAERCDAWISECRKECFKGKKLEFKFNKSCDAHRQKFLDGVSKFDFLYLGFVLNKCKLYSPGFAHKESFYKYTCKCYLKMRRAT